MEEEFWTIVSRIKRECIEYATDWLLYQTDFLQAPASTCYHGSWPGGLIDHSVGVATLLEELTEKNSIPWDSPDSPLIVGLFHDICKAGMYKVQTKRVQNPNTGQWETKEFYYVDDSTPLGHGEKSVILLSQHIKLTEQEIYAIRWHMSSYESPDERRSSEKALTICPVINWVRTADKLEAARSSGMQIRE
jgi:HD superfamily phosphohydrolase YqeK